MVNIDHDTGEHGVYKTSSPPYAVWFQSLITIVLPGHRFFSHKTLSSIDKPSQLKLAGNKVCLCHPKEQRYG
ncbi:MAG: hypothetical protein QY310_00455 [Candidatus Jettenia sp. CY-1]|nr:hypothetical protein [Candidatus Jettenia sp.]WKZ19052.1 MAG: hypothetical protein QY310_00455 [Candidatus Jettenia sp. CY-1]